MGLNKIYYFLVFLAKPGSFITALSDVIDNAINIVQTYLDKEGEEVLSEIK